MASDSEVVRVARQFRRDVLSREANALAQMAQVWRDTLLRLDNEIEALAQEMIERRRAGLPVKAWHVYRMERYQELIKDVAERWTVMTALADSVISNQQQQLGELGIRHAERLLEAQEPSIVSLFDRLPTPAVQELVGIAGDGKPLNRLIKEVAPAAVDGMTRELVQGVALGIGPKQLARRMERGLNVGLNRLLVITRTETLRVYRITAIDRWEQTGQVIGHQRVVAHSPRTCAACLADEGHVYPIDVPISEHPQGRCTSIPVLADRGPLQWYGGAQWFADQRPEVQQRILGKGRYAAWRAGKFRFEDVLKRVPNRVWGESLQVRSLQELVG